MEGGERIVEYVDAHTWRHELHAATQTVFGAIAQLQEHITMSDKAQLDALTKISGDISHLSDVITGMAQDVAAVKNALDSANADGAAIPQELTDAINTAAQNADAAATAADQARSQADQIAATAAPQGAPLPAPPAETGGAAPVTDSTPPHG